MITYSIKLKYYKISGNKKIQALHKKNIKKLKTLLPFMCDIDIKNGENPSISIKCTDRVYFFDKIANIELLNI